MLTLAGDHLKNQKNKNMSANLDNGVILGALGSAFTNTTTPITPPAGMVIAAIQFITGGGAATPKITALVAETPGKFFNTAHAANAGGTHTTTDGSHPVPSGSTVEEGTGGKTLGSETIAFPAGMTLYGRWTSATFTGDSAGGVICYFGY